MSGIIEVITSMDIPSDETVETNIPGVKVFRGVSYMPRQPVLYDPGICVLLQGRKTVSLGGAQFAYDVDNYLVVSVNIPLDAEIFANPEEPVIGMIIDIDMTQLHDLLSITGFPLGLSERLSLTKPRAVEPARMEPEMRNTIERMASCLTSKVEARVLGPGLVREVLYRAMCGLHSSALFALANHSGPFARIAHVLRIIQTKYAEKLDVDYLAREAHMGASAFHQTFKEVTSESPMQYLKIIRLTKARDLIMQEKEKVYIAADSVGYESTSQFSREFKRYFGESPSLIDRQSKHDNVAKDDIKYVQ